jgi:hypothetical protein
MEVVDLRDELDEIRGCGEVVFLGDVVGIFERCWIERGRCFIEIVTC